MFSFPWDVGIRENDLWSVKGEMEEGRGWWRVRWRKGGGWWRVRWREGVVEGEVEGGGGGG